MVKNFSAYDAALMFSYSFKFLYHRHLSARITGSYEDFGLIVPAMVNGAFACELFLKSLLKNSPRGHKLYNDLFCKLDLYTAKELETIVIECFKKKKNTIINSEQFILNLKIVDRAFEELRYFYEPKDNYKQKVYNLDFIEVLVFSLKAICEQKYGVRPVRT